MQCNAFYKTNIIFIIQSGTITHPFFSVLTRFLFLKKCKNTIGYAKNIIKRTHKNGLKLGGISYSCS